MSGPRVSPFTRDAVLQLMRQLPPDGVSSERLARIGRLSPQVVAEALKQLEEAGAVVRSSLLSRGQLVTVWHRV